MYIKLYVFRKISNLSNYAKFLSKYYLDFKAVIYFLKFNFKKLYRFNRILIYKYKKRLLCFCFLLFFLLIQIIA